jgi:cell division protease FtsH
MAKAMVTRYGMSDILGHQVYGEPNQEVFLGRDFSSTPNYSEQTANTIDEEVARLMTTAHDTAYRILSEHREQLDLMAQVLLERETVEGKAVDSLLNNKWDEYLEWEKEHPKEAEQDKKAIELSAVKGSAQQEEPNPQPAPSGTDSPDMSSGSQPPETIDQ